MRAPALRQRLGLVFSVTLSLLAALPAMSAADLSSQMGDIKGESSDDRHPAGTQTQSLGRDPQSGVASGKRTYHPVATVKENSSTGGGSQGQGTGNSTSSKVQVQDLHITRKLDKSSPILIQDKKTSRPNLSDISLPKSQDTSSPKVMDDKSSGGDKGSKPNITEVHVVKTSDGASTTLMDDKANSGDKGSKGNKEPYLKVELQDGTVSSYQAGGSGGGTAQASHGGGNNSGATIPTNAAAVRGFPDDIPIDDGGTTAGFGGAQGSHGHLNVNGDGKPAFTNTGFAGLITSPVQPQQSHGPQFDKGSIQTLQQQLQSVNNMTGSNPGTAGGTAGFTGGVRTMDNVGKFNIGQMGGIGGATSLPGGNISGAVHAGIAVPNIGGAVSTGGLNPQPLPPPTAIHGGAVIQQLGGAITTGGGTTGGVNVGGRPNLLPAVQHMNLLGR